MSLAEAYNASCKHHGVEPIQHCSAQLATGVAPFALDLRGNTVPLQQQKRRLNDTDFNALADVLLDNRTLISTLDISYNDIGDGAAASLGDVVLGCGISVLNASSNAFSGLGAKILSSTLATCTDLQSLDLSNNTLSDEGGVAVAALAGSHPALCWLSLRHTDIGINTIIALSAAIASTRSLQTLDISDPLLFSRDDDATTHIARALRVNRSVTSLRLSKHRFFDFAATSILTDCLLDNCVVKHLDLTANSIGGPGAAAIARALAAGVPLERLDLTSCRICDEGAAALAGVVITGCSLRSLNVKRCEIGDAGIAALAGTIGEGILPYSPDDDAADGGRRSQGATALGFLLDLQVAGNELRRGRPGTTAMAHALLRLRDSAPAALGEAGPVSTQVDVLPFFVDGVAELALI